jgi:adenine phosphoribosyltransferase
MHAVQSEVDLASYIRDVPDFPKPGIVFKDITPLLAHADAFEAAVSQMTSAVEKFDPTHILGIESRGFIFGAPMALRLARPFIIARKLGKLPYHRVTEEYALEYGTNTIEMHNDSLQSGDRVAIVDDLLATGGTALACARLVEKMDAKVACFSFLVELTFLTGRHSLREYEICSVIDF